MKRLIILLLVSPLWAQLPTVLNVREALPCTAATGSAVCTAGNTYAAGVTRTNDNFTVGIPIADSDGINCGGSACTINAIAPNVNLRLQNSSGTQLNSQFKVLANWPSGNVKWVLVDGLASPTAIAGSPDTADQSNILCKVGTTVSGVTCGATGGNFGGSNLATDNTSTISVSTGVATFTVKKTNFDVLDAANVGVKNLLFSGSPGVVVMGPVADGATTTCSTIAACNVAYQSSNDATSTAKIEENGPLKTVIEAEGGLVNGTETYMRFRCRETFYKNKTNVAITCALRNADEGASNSFASAYKGHASWSIQLNPALGPSPAWTFGTDTSTPATGSFVGTESAYLYQAFSNFEENPTAWQSSPNCPSGGGYCIVSPITRTGSGSTESYAQDGYTIVYNGTALTGYPKAHTAYPQGWGDLTDGSGSGILVGVKYLSAYWPKELNFTSSLITIGLNPIQSDWPGGGGIPYYQVWPDYHMETVYLSFHNGALASEANTFLAQQYQLIAKASGSTGLDPITYYNNAKDATTGLGALLYPLVSQSEQDSFWQNRENQSNCAYNATPAVTINCWPYPAHVWSNSGAVHDISPDIFRGWPWALSSSNNQHEKQWGYLVNRWLERSHTGAYLNAVQFYKYEMEDALVHSDVAASTDTACNSFGLDPTGKQIFHFRCAAVSYLDSTGYPGAVTSSNSSLGMRNWANAGNGYEHAHWYGLTDYYFLTGDMFAYEALLQGAFDMFAETRTGSQQGTSLVNVGISRAIGHFLDGAARSYRWAVDVGDPTSEAATIGSVIQTFMNALVVTTDYCPSSAQGAWPGPCKLSVPAGGFTAGVSRTRGVGGAYQGNTNGVDNNGGGDVNCPTINGLGFQPCGKPWMDGIEVEGMYEVYSDVGATELNALGISPTLLFDLMDGIGNWADRETFILGTTGTEADSKLSYDVLLNGISPMTYILSATVAEYEFDYYLLGLYQGSLSPIQQERFMQNYTEWAANESMNPDLMDDHDMYESSNVIYAIDHPTNQLSTLILPTSTVPSVCTGVTSCTVNWTAPTPPTGQGILSYRLKEDPTGKTFTEWIGYEPTLYCFSPTARGCVDPSTGVNTCSGNPTTTTPWFAGTEVTPAPASNVTSFVVTGLSPTNTYTFALKATFGTGAPPPPPPPSRALTTTQR